MPVCRNQYHDHSHIFLWHGAQLFIIHHNAHLQPPRAKSILPTVCLSVDSESTREKRVEVFAQQLRTAALLAAETDVSTIVLPVLARALLHARQRERPPHIKTSTINSGLMRTPAEDRLGGMNWQNLGQVRQQVPERTAWGKEDKGCHRENEGNAAGEVIWAPTLAVFRAVEAILCGGGRPRTTFVCPKSDWTANLSSECNPSK